jgi:hypothetical protein
LGLPVKVTRAFDSAGARGCSPALQPHLPRVVPAQPQGREIGFYLAMRGQSSSGGEGTHGPDIGRGKRAVTRPAEAACLGWGRGFNSRLLSGSRDGP